MNESKINLEAFKFDLMEFAEGNGKLPCFELTSSKELISFYDEELYKTIKKSCNFENFKLRKHGFKRKK